MAENWQRGGFGLYVHWPFCAAKCPYCDFNSHVSADVNSDAWLGAYLSEIDRWADETPKRVLTSIFFGGGTPSLMAPGVVEKVIARATARWTAANDLEVTLEANPTSVEAGNFAAFRNAGVNRVSVGLQALNDADLRALGRMHSAKEGLAALDVAQDTFARVSFDLIYGRQNQTLSDWDAELTRALQLGTDHLSLYQLTIEDGTAFAQRYQKGGLRGLPREDLAADLFEATQDLCDLAGCPAYETSNHARAGQECRHNLIYWHMGDYVGIGPGAHGRVTLGQHRMATNAEVLPATWLASAGMGETSHEARDRLSPREQAEEYVIMALRTREGIDMAVLDGFGVDMMRPNAIEALSELGLVEISGDAMRTTRRGRPLLNAVLRELLAD